jgi:hypothetical protein
MSAILPGGNRETEKNKATTRWVLATMIYLGLGFITIIGPIPEWGIQGSLSDFGMDSTSNSGLWFDEPWRPIAMGGDVLFYAGTI